MNNVTIRCGCMEVYIVDLDTAKEPLICKTCKTTLFMPTPSFEKITEKASVTEDSQFVDSSHPSVKEILQAREETHGDFTENSIMSRKLRNIIFQKLEERGYKRSELPAFFEEAIIFVCHKFARMACGNPAHDDHWADIGGYSALTAERLRKGNVSLVRHKVPKRSAFNLSSEE